MKVTQEFAFRFARASVRMGSDGIAQVVVRGVLSHAAEFQRWVLDMCEDINARGAVVDFRRAVVAVDWPTYARDPRADVHAVRMLPIAVVVNPALEDEMRDVVWCRARQGHMRAAFLDAVSATTWATDRAWVDSL